MHNTLCMALYYLLLSNAQNYNKKVLSNISEYANGMNNIAKKFKNGFHKDLKIARNLVFPILNSTTKKETGKYELISNIKNMQRL